MVTVVIQAVRRESWWHWLLRQRWAWALLAGFALVNGLNFGAGILWPSWAYTGFCCGFTAVNIVRARRLRREAHDTWRRYGHEHRN